MGNYDDIIHLPHHVSKVHPPMSKDMRAAQFAPFAALTGLNDAIAEMGWQTDNWVDLEDTGNSELDNQLALLMTSLSRKPSVTICYLTQDNPQADISLQSVTGNAQRIDEAERSIELADGRKISIDRITEILIRPTEEQ